MTATAVGSILGILTFQNLFAVVHSASFHFLAGEDTFAEMNPAGSIKDNKMFIPGVDFIVFSSFCAAHFSPALLAPYFISLT